MQRKARSKNAHEPWWRNCSILPVKRVGRKQINLKLTIRQFTIVWTTKQNLPGRTYCKLYSKYYSNINGRIFAPASSQHVWNSNTVAFCRQTERLEWKFPQPERKTHESGCLPTNLRIVRSLRTQPTATLQVLSSQNGPSRTPVCQHNGMKRAATGTWHV